MPNSHENKVESYKGDAVEGRKGAIQAEVKFTHCAILIGVVEVSGSVAIKRDYEFTIGE